jgi:hypothetical protein
MKQVPEERKRKFAIAGTIKERPRLAFLAGSAGVSPALQGEDAGGTPALPARNRSICATDGKTSANRLE